MKQALILTTILFIYSHSIYSQAKADKNVLTGKITDAKTGTPLSGASVFIHDLKTGAIAHDDGTFKTSSIAPGKYLVEISSVGFETIIESVEVNPNGSVTVTE